MRSLCDILKQDREPGFTDDNKDMATQNKPKLNSTKIISDNPIALPEEDTIDRNRFAQSFAKQMLSLDTSQGSVVGVLGPWGSGKTSLINLTKNELNKEDVVILDFNPWMFSGTEQLMQYFFAELSAQLRIKPGLNEIGEAIGTYGDLFTGMGWLPIVGPWIERGHKVTKNIRKVLQVHKEGVGAHRKKIEQVLNKHNKMIIIVIDDIDRLSTSEIRDIFKLVRLTANFPNIIYIVAFDRIRVEKALEEDGINGRDYLEKILQVAIDIPPVSYQALSTQVTTAIGDAIKDIESVGPFDKEIWPDIFEEIIKPLIRTMRDVRRYAVNIRGTVDTLSGEIALTDVLALEAIRIFMPDVFKLLHSSMDALTTTTNYRFVNNTGTENILKAKIEEMVKVSESNADLVKDMICRLFPAGRRHIQNDDYGVEWRKEWLRERRVAHEDILQLYLEHFVGDHLKAFLHAEKAHLLMHNRDLFDQYLRSLDDFEKTDVITALEDYEDQYKPESAEPASIVLLNLLPTLTDSRTNMFEYGVSTKVIRVVYRLIRLLKDPNETERVVKSILLEVNTLSAKYELITIIGYVEGQGHKLVSVKAANQLEVVWAHEVKEASEDELIKEPDLLRVLLNAQKYLAKIDEEIAVKDTAELTLAILKSASSEAMSQSMDSRRVRKETHLAWESLIKLYGNEDILINCIEQSKDLASVDYKAIIELADRYIKGWRPENF